jgi:hypothetical protein
VEITMLLVKETRNFLVYAQTNNDQNALDDVDAIVMKWYLRKSDFNDFPELITVTVQPKESENGTD